MQNAVWLLAVLIIGLVACDNGPPGAGPDGSVVTPPDECGWSQLGGALNRNPDHAAETPAIALSPVDDRIAVAWIEQTEQGRRDLYVKTWENGGWVTLGEAQQQRGDDSAWSPQLAWGPDGILLAWHESAPFGDDTPDRVYVKRWDPEQKQWLLLGNQVSHDPTRQASQPALVLDSGGKVIVAWTESRTGEADVYAAEWDGQGWRGLGDALFHLGELAAGPFLAIDPTDDQPMIAYLRGPLITSIHMADARVAKWNGTDSWLFLGEGVMEVPWVVVSNSLAVTSKGDPFIATGYDDLSGVVNTRVSRFDGTDQSWTALGSLDPVERYSSPVIAIDPQTDQPVIAAEAQKLVIKRYDGGKWAPVCVRTGYLGYRSPFSPAFAIRPSGTGVVAFVDGERPADARIYVKQGPLK